MKISSFYLIFLLIQIYSTLNVNSALTPLVASETYPNLLDVFTDLPKQYQMFWKVVNTNEMQFEIHCKTTG